MVRRDAQDGEDDAPAPPRCRAGAGDIALRADTLGFAPQPASPGQADVLLRPHGPHRVHPRGPPRGQERAERGDGEQHGGHRDERGRVRRRDPEHQAFEEAGQDQGRCTGYLGPEVTVGRSNQCK